MKSTLLQRIALILCAGTFPSWFGGEEISVGRVGGVRVAESLGAEDEAANDTLVPRESETVLGITGTSVVGNESLAVITEPNKQIELVCHSPNPFANVYWVKSGYIFQNPFKFFSSTRLSGLYKCYSFIEEELVLKSIRVFVHDPGVGVTGAEMLRKEENLTLDCTFGYKEKENLQTSYVWYFNGGKIQSDDRHLFQDNSLVVFNSQITDAGAYICEIRNPDFKEKAVKFGYIEIGSLPEIAEQSKGKTRNICVPKGTIIWLFCQPLGYPLPVLQWYVDRDKLKPGRGVFYLRRFFNVQDALLIVRVQKSVLFTCQAKNKHGHTRIRYSVWTQRPPYPIRCDSEVVNKHSHLVASCFTILVALFVSKFVCSHKGF